MTRLQIATHLVASSPWVNVSRDQTRGRDEMDVLLTSALTVAGRLIDKEEQSRPKKKQLLPGVRRFCQWLLARFYR